MDLRIAPYEERDVPAVRAFNERLARGGSAWRFPTSPVASWLPKLEGRRIWREMYLAREGEAVRGAYVLKHQEFTLGDGERRWIGCLQLPLSEGIVERRYAMVGVTVVKDAVARSPLLYTLGGGGFDQPLLRMQKALGWALHEVPFFFKVRRAAPFLRNIRPLRTSRARALALDTLAASGLGAVGLRVADLAVTRARAPRGAVEPVDRFGSWADALWERARGAYSLLAVRDAEALDLLYPESDARFLRLRVSEPDGPIGWAVCLCTPMQDHKQFGDMRVGSLVDCLALPGREVDVVAAAVGRLRAAGADVIVANQASAAWREAHRRCGFLPGPSNFILSASPELARALAPLERSAPRIHLTRGDGDGPINL
jgi:hypothetical protein